MTQQPTCPSQPADCATILTAIGEYREVLGAALDSEVRQRPDWNNRVQSAFGHIKLLSSVLPGELFDRFCLDERIETLAPDIAAHFAA